MSSTKRNPHRRGIAVRVDKSGREQYRGTAYDKRAKRHLYGPWTYTLAEARAWRVDALAGSEKGTRSADRGVTVRVAAEQFVAGIESGAIRNRSGGVYKPSAVHGIRRELNNRVVVAFGAAYLREVTLPDVQRWADQLAAQGLAPSTVRNVANALRSLYAWALPRGMATVNPTAGLRLPTGGKARDRIATPAEARALIAALDPRDQAALGLAVYAGLRRGELLALDWSSIGLDAGVLHVRRAWDASSCVFVTPKSKAGTRIVPITERLALLLADHRVLTDHRDGLLFAGRDPQRPITPGALSARMTKRWKAAGLTPLGLHEGRHTAASMFIRAGLNAKTVTAIMGHASIAITFDRYGHLFPGSEHEARGLLDAYLADDEPLP
jgi:integrase